MTIKNPAFFNRKRDCYRQAKIGISFAAVAYRWILSAEDSHLFSTGSRFPDLRIGAGPRLLTDIAMTSCGWLPVYSDRIVRDFHPIPFYPPMAALSGLCSCVRFSGFHDSTLEKFVKHNLEKDGAKQKISARMENWTRMEQHFLDQLCYNPLIREFYRQLHKEHPAFVANARPGFYELDTHPCF